MGASILSRDATPTHTGGATVRRRNRLRKEAIDELDAAVVHRVDRANDVIDEDIEWGLHELRA